MHVIPFDLRAIRSQDAPGHASFSDTPAFQTGVASVSDALAQRIVDGLKGGEFCVLYQSAFTVSNRQPARIDTQLRWQHPDYGVLPQEAFASALAEPDVALEAAAFVIQTASAALAELQQAGAPACTLAVHVPAPLLLASDVAAALTGLAGEHGIAAHWLDFEVEDSVEAAQVLTRRGLMRTWRDTGARLSMGGFGGTVSSLGQIGACDIDTIVLTRDLIERVPDDARASTVLGNLLAMFESLGLQTVVNGVDKEPQTAWLASWGAVNAQGAYWGRPTTQLERVFA